MRSRSWMSRLPRATARCPPRSSGETPGTGDALGLDDIPLMPGAAEGSPRNASAHSLSAHAPPIARHARPPNFVCLGSPALVSPALVGLQAIDICVRAHISSAISASHTLAKQTFAQETHPINAVRAPLACPIPRRLVNPPPPSKGGTPSRTAGRVAAAACGPQERTARRRSTSGLL